MLTGKIRGERKVPLSVRAQARRGLPRTAPDAQKAPTDRAGGCDRRAAVMQTRRLRFDPDALAAAGAASIAGLANEAQAKGKQRPGRRRFPRARRDHAVDSQRQRRQRKVPAKVMWGRQLLGETPLSLQWPADSGPLDVVVAAPAVMPVHTRLYTFADDKVVVKLVDDEGQKALFGYKREPRPARSWPGLDLDLARNDRRPGPAARLPVGQSQPARRCTRSDRPTPPPAKSPTPAK